MKINIILQSIDVLYNKTAIKNALHSNNIYFTFTYDFFSYHNKSIDSISLLSNFYFIFTHNLQFQRKDFHFQFGFEPSQGLHEMPGHV